MGGGLMQLVAYGAQDIYLTGNPQITFFKVVYRRHTNFSMEDIIQDGAGTVGFGNEVDYTISRNGDLIHKMYFEIEPKLFVAKPIHVDETHTPEVILGSAGTLIVGDATVAVKPVITSGTGTQVFADIVGIPGPGPQNVTYASASGTVQLYVIDTTANPVFEVGGVTKAQNQPSDHTTYIVTFKRNTDTLGGNMSNVYALAGNASVSLSCPQSFQVGQGFGTNKTAPSGLLADVSDAVLFDSFITVGGSFSNDGQISAAGINFEGWSVDSDLVVTGGEGGAVFWMHPDDGPSITNPSTEVVLGQFTISDSRLVGTILPRFTGLLQGMTTDGSSWQASFDITIPEVEEITFEQRLLGHSYTNNLSNSLLKEIEVEIGGQKIDKHYSHWLTTWNELSTPNDYGHKAQVTPGGEPFSHGGGSRQVNSIKEDNLSFNHKSATLTNESFLTPTKAYIPLKFWFNRNPGLALPLIALQYHEVKIKTKFEEYSNLVTLPNSPDAVGRVLEPLNNSIHSNVSFYVQYIYLDTDERRRFAQVSHEYLIEQLQYQTFPDSKIYELNFNHPVKELIWTGKHSNYNSYERQIGNGTPKSMIIDNNWLLKLNGHDRFEPRKTSYFTRQQVYEHHSGYGGTTMRDSIAVYSFALKPEEHQPSGTCNFSRIDTAQLLKDGTWTYVPEPINIYAVNYNVLRIMSGMGGLAYSN